MVCKISPHITRCHSFHSLWTVSDPRLLKLNCIFQDSVQPIVDGDVVSTPKWMNPDDLYHPNGHGPSEGEDG